MTSPRHVEIRESDPEAGETVADGVDELTLALLSFDSDAPISVTVRDGAGNDFVVGEPLVRSGGSTIVVPLEPLPEGDYRVLVEAMSTDGDGLSSLSYDFTVEDGGTGGLGVLAVWAVALAILAAIFLRPGSRKKRST